MDEGDVEQQRVPSEDKGKGKKTYWQKALSTFWRTGEDRIEHPGCKESLLALACDPWLIGILVLVPFAWAAHWRIETWGHNTTFVLCFIAMIPLQKMFDYGGDQMGTFLHADFRDLLVITMSNAVEATLSIILLRNCELRLLQSTIIGVVLLHLLLIPGIPFFVDGSQIFEQILHPHHASQNLSLLMIGVLAILVPTAYFAALDNGVDTAVNGAQSGLPPQFVPLVGDAVRRDILKMSRGISVILLVIYVVSRWYRHSPPETLNPLGDDVDRTRAARHRRGAAEHVPKSELHPLVCFLLLVVVTGLMAPTAEFLVSSIEDVRRSSGIQTEWFGLILLPMMSCSADGVVGVGKFCMRVKKYLEVKSKTKNHEDGDKSSQTMTTGGQNQTSGEGESRSSTFASEFAHGRPIDLSIQFTLWWTPFLVLLGWWTERPMHLLFDYFEVALLLGSCFLVNYITADYKTNMSEGLTMISFYLMIATATWYYPGQPQAEYMLSCPGSVAQAIADATGHES